MSTPANFNGAKPILNADDAVMLLVDHQSGLFQTLGDMPMPVLRAHVNALAKIARLAKLPVVSIASFQGVNLLFKRTTWHRWPFSHLPGLGLLGFLGLLAVVAANLARPSRAGDQHHSDRRRSLGFAVDSTDHKS